MVLLIDTNIILDVLLSRSDFVKESSIIWKLCETEQAKGYISTLTYANIMYIMRKQMTSEQIEDVFRKLKLIFEFADFSSVVLEMAVNMKWKDFEDAFKRSFKTTEEKEQEDKKLPELSKGQTFDGVQTKISEHYTTPPKHFTEDSLLSAMERAGNEDMSDDVERKGLGTPATRADIIEKLVKDGFVKREKKQMLPTEDGMKLITVLPDVVKSSKLTADWENALSHEVEIGADPLGNLQRLSNALEGMTGKMADVEQKLSNVEHQLETAKVEVTKPFAQEQELAEKLERLAELNALLNMDEKGDNALDMGDDEPDDETGEQSAQTQEGEPDRAEDIQAVADEPLKPVASFLMSERIAEHDKERMLADGSRGRVSVKEKLAEMKQKISDQKMPEKPKTKSQEASL